MANGYTVAAEKSIAWDTPEKALAALNKATADNRDVAPARLTAGVNVVANGKNYTLKYDGTTYTLKNAEGEDIILDLLNKSAGNVVIGNKATDDQVNTYLRKVFAGKHLLTDEYDFGTGKVTVNGEQFVISKFVIKNGNIEATVNGADVKAVMINSTTVTVTSDKPLDKNVEAVEAMFGGVFQSK